MAVSSTSAAALSSSLRVFLYSREIQWAAGGWAFFIAENAILSENRTYLIAEFGDRGYHGVYGSLSTAAMASIGYAYFKLRKNAVAGSITIAATTVPRHQLFLSWTLMTLGLTMASQAVPKMQIPVTSNLDVRCPFDFADQRRSKSSSNTIGPVEVELHGLERVTRHAGLWSLALVAAAHSGLAASRPLQVWWLGPTAVAWLGGMHTDSRFRRGMGSSLDPFYDSVTSNVPFLAMLTGRQGSVSQAVTELVGDIKPLNAGMATLIATAWIITKGRVKLRA